MRLLLEVIVTNNVQKFEITMVSERVSSYVESWWRGLLDRNAYSARAANQNTFIEPFNRTYLNTVLY